MSDFVTLLHQSPLVGDFGPQYHEFHGDQWIKEPWNAFSSLFFLVPVFYWVWKLKGQYRRHAAITIALPFLFLNGMGSTIYHAFRAHSFWLYLDFMPAMILMVLLAVYFWNKIIGNWWISSGIVVALTVGRILLFYVLKDHVDKSVAISIGYFITGFMILVPLLFMLIRTQWFKWHLIALTFLFLGAALFFRNLDYPTPNPFPEFLPQGTHFLWHVVSAFAVFSLGWYLFHIRERELEEIK